MPFIPIGKLAFVTSTGFGSSGRISVIEGNHQTGTQAYKTRDLGFLPDGNRIIYSANDLIRGEDGRESVANGIYIYDLKQQTNILVMTNVKSGAEPSMSPDGTKIAFVVYDNGRKSSQIYTAKADGSNRKQLTKGQYYNWTPRWSPDGKQVVFETTRNANADNNVTNGGYRDIYVMDSDGQNQANLTMNSYGHHPSWSLDGKFIAYMAHRSVFVMRADGSNKHNVSQGKTRDSEPVWSPDSQWVAFTRTAGNPPAEGAMDIWIMKSDGTEQHPVTFNKNNFTSYSPNWSK